MVLVRFRLGNRGRLGRGCCRDGDLRVCGSRRRGGRRGRRRRRRDVWLRGLRFRRSMDDRGRAVRRGLWRRRRVCRLLHARTIFGRGGNPRRGAARNDARRELRGRIRARGCLGSFSDPGDGRPGPLNRGPRTLAPTCAFERRPCSGSRLRCWQSARVAGSQRRACARSDRRAVLELAGWLNSHVDSRCGSCCEEPDSTGQRKLGRGERARAGPRRAAGRRPTDAGPHDLDRRQDQRSEWRLVVRARPSG